MKHTPLLPLLIAAMFVAASDFALNLRQIHFQPKIEQLSVQPITGEPYFLGNSMFKTGIDFDLLAKLTHAPKPLRFSYHDGHYSNLWYLILKNALIPSEIRPSLVVWGFRPTYAIHPAFRKRAACDIEKFEFGTDPEFAKLSAIPISSDDPALGFERVSYFYRNRRQLRERVTEFVNRTVVRAFEIARISSADRIKRELQTKRLSVADLVIQHTSRGAAAMTEEDIVDAGAAFVTGPKARFTESFIPRIATLLKDAKIPQLVLIFKPVSFSSGNAEIEPAEFARDAARYFEANEIPHIDYTRDADLIPTDYGAGDHYNTSGRRKVTEQIAHAVLSYKNPKVTTAAGQKPTEAPTP